MGSYKIGYKKPPKGKPFKPGESGNPAGRPPRGSNQLGEIVKEVLDGEMEFRERGQPKKATRQEVSIKRLVEKAVKGDVIAADLLLKKRASALKHGEKSARRLTVVNWLPDYPGQTGEQKGQGRGRPANKTVSNDGQSNGNGQDPETDTDPSPGGEG